MKGHVSLSLSAKEALALLKDPNLAGSVLKKVVAALRVSDVTPQGAKAAVLSRSKPARKAKAAATSEAQPQQ